MRLTHCAHCGHSRISIPVTWLTLSGMARFYYCSRPCWLAGPREYGVAVQDRDLRGRPLEAFVVPKGFVESAARSSIYAVYKCDPLRFPLDSPTHIWASREGDVGVRRLLRRSQ